MGIVAGGGYVDGRIGVGVVLFIGLASEGD